MVTNSEEQKTPFFSIIVPVYKVEKYITGCIESVLKQSFSNWELLLVDDGTPDTSGIICDRYAANDCRIRVFHKKNGGVSSARNYALNKVKGDWIVFLDSDDKFYPTALELMSQAIVKEPFDVLQFGYNRVWGQDDDSFKETPILSPKLYVEKDNCNTAVWGNCVRASIIKDNNITFNESLRIGEDQVFIFDFLKYSKGVKRIKDILYYYNDNATSVMNNPKLQDLMQLITFFSVYKKSNTMSVISFDNMILLWLYHIILNRLLPYKEIVRLYKTACISNCRDTNSFGVKLLFKVARYNVGLGVLLCQLAVRLKN